jgi:hypothetical protein
MHKVIYCSDWLECDDKEYSIVRIYTNTAMTTYDKTTIRITDPNGTMTIEYPDSATVISVPYRNGTTSIDVEEYQKCMLNAEKTVEDTANLMGTNIQENSFKFVEDDPMDFCILFNSEKKTLTPPLIIFSRS